MLSQKLLCTYVLLVVLPLLFNRNFMDLVYVLLSIEIFPLYRGVADDDDDDDRWPISVDYVLRFRR